MAGTIRFLAGRGIPVMAHVGLTPQSVNAFGGYKVQGRGGDADRILRDARRCHRGRRLFGRAGKDRRAAGARDHRKDRDSDHRHRRFGSLRRPDPGGRRHAGPVHRIPAEIRQALCRARQRGRRGNRRLCRAKCASGAFPVAEHVFGDVPKTVRRGPPHERADRSQRCRSFANVVAGWRREGAKVGVVPTMGALHRGHLSLVRDGSCPQPTGSSSPCSSTRSSSTVPPILPPIHARKTKTPPSCRRRARICSTCPMPRRSTPMASPPPFPWRASARACAAPIGRAISTASPPLSQSSSCRPAPMSLSSAKRISSSCMWCAAWPGSGYPVEIVGCATVREADGLALSSRNTRLSAAERTIAPRLAAILFDAASKLSAGGAARPVIEAAKAAIVEAGFHNVEYLELRGHDDLRPLERADRPARLLVAAWLGDVRLIDNAEVVQHSAIRPSFATLMAAREFSNRAKESSWPNPNFQSEAPRRVNLRIGLPDAKTAR